MILGHPPFGHKGEEVLNDILKDECGLKYEGNAQNFRILMFLEKRAGSDSGLDLTAAVLLAINKYPFSLEDPGRLKGVYGMEWEGIAFLRKLGECRKAARRWKPQLMDLCDDIAYSTHDIEDGIRAGKIQMNPSLFEDDRLIEGVMQEIIDDPGNAVCIGRQVDMKLMVKQALHHYLQQWETIYVECGGSPRERGGR